MKGALTLLGLLLLTAPVGAQEVLPFPYPPMVGSVGTSMEDSVHKWRQQPRYLPEDAPNILIVDSETDYNHDGKIDDKTHEARSKIGEDWDERSEALDAAVVDHDRAHRCGFPEVVFCEGKRPEDAAAIAEEGTRLGVRLNMITNGLLADRELIRRARAAGIREFIVKPIDLSDLAAVIRKLLDN